MNILISPHKLKGKPKLISSKSFTHRAIICACLAEGVSVIKNANLCDDIKETINALREFVNIEVRDTTITVCGGIKTIKKKHYQINESGTTLRLLLPLVSFYSDSSFDVELGQQLYSRPTDEFLKIIEKVEYIDNKNTIVVNGFLDKDEYKISNKKSSQFASGMLILAPNLAHNTTITLDNDFDSIGYIDLTINVLKQFGIEVYRNGNKLFVIGNQKYKPTTLVVPTDLSIIGFYKAMNILGSSIDLSDVVCDESDPNLAFYSMYNSVDDFNTKVIDVSSVPDYALSLFAASSVSNHAVSFAGVDKLAYKESNRIKSILEASNSLGLKVSYDGKILLIEPSSLVGGFVDSFNDHRIVFYTTALSTICDSDVFIKNVDCVKKSYPEFFKDLERLGFEYKPIDSQKEITYKIGNDETKIVFGNDSISDVRHYFKQDTKYLIVTDKNIPENLVSSIKNPQDSNVDVLRLDSCGESIKTEQYLDKIYDFLLENNFSKSDYLVALGGGTITDLVGFASMTYKRGMKFISIPTTLLSQIDASIGGKVAINKKGIKNCVGGFYSPELIVVDPQTLKTLPAKELKSGMGELIKIAAISDSKLFYDVLDSSLYEKLDSWILLGIVNKLKFVKSDPYDLCERHALNFGHTYGHVIEVEEGISHGEAIVKGMSLVSKNESLISCLKKYDFDVLNPEQSYKYKNKLLNDKKIENGKLTLVELDEIGKYKFKEIDI